MAVMKRTKLARSEALIRTETLHRRGWSQTEIAAELGVSQPQISYDISQINKKYLESAVEEHRLLVNEKRAQMREVRREAWLAYERSKEDAEKEVEEHGLRKADDDEQPAKGKKGKAKAVDGTMEESFKKLKIITTKEGRLPANEYLQTIRSTLQDECELLGLWAPKKTIGVTGTPLDWAAVLGSAAQPQEPEVELEALEQQAQAFVPPGETHVPGESYWGGKKNGDGNGKA